MDYDFMSNKEKKEMDKLYKLSTPLSIYNQPKRLSPEALEEGFFPPPWNIYDHPEKTKGWIEFQRALRKDPKYYLQGCDSPNHEYK